MTDAQYRRIDPVNLDLIATVETQQRPQLTVPCDPQAASIASRLDISARSPTQRHSLNAGDVVSFHARVLGDLLDASVYFEIGATVQLGL